MNSKFNQMEYIAKYNKEHYKTFKVELLIKEKEELDELLKKHNLTKAQFLRNSIEELKKKSINK